MSLSSPIFNMFARSPLKPLEAHMKNVNQCAQCLAPFFQAVVYEDWETAAKMREQVAEREAAADTLKQDLRLHLPKGLFLPVARSDILALLVIQDRVANKAKDIAGLIVGRQMKIPETIAGDMVIYLQRSLDAVQQATEIVAELDQLLEAGFRGNEVRVIEDMIVALDQIENETDEQQIDLRRQLFLIEKELHPVDAVFLYKILEWMGELADRAQDIGGQLHLLLAR